jgi:hypothetical protein
MNRGDQQIADQLGLCRQIVGGWRERFAVAQIDGLEDLPRFGRPARILAPTIDEVVRLTTQAKPAAETHWSTRNPGAGSRSERCHSGPDLAGTRIETALREELQAE